MRGHGLVMFAETVFVYTRKARSLEFYISFVEEIVYDELLPKFSCPSPTFMCYMHSLKIQASRLRWPQANPSLILPR